MFSALALALTLFPRSARAAEPFLLPRAYSHNDYNQARPLLDALDHGFCAVEADVFLVDGRLLVAHTRRGVRPERTLQSLYLDPLRARIQANGGRVYAGGPLQFLLMIDVKTDAADTYRALKQALEPYQGLLTRFGDQETHPGAITVVLSGNRDRDLMKEEPLRYAALDGRLGDLDSDIPPSLMPVISDTWGIVSEGVDLETQPVRLARNLQGYVERAHAHGRKLRFWNIPDREAGWKLMYEGGVDLINTDNVSGLADYLKSREKP